MVGFRSAAWAPWVWATALLAGGCSGASHPRPEAALEHAPPGPAPLVYEVSVDPSLETLRARVCFEGVPPPRLEAMTDVAALALRQLVGPDGEPLTMDGRGASLARVGPGECVRYAIDLHRAAAASRRAAFTSDDLLIGQEAWLLRPSRAPHAGTLTFRLPEGVRVATPFPSDASGALRLDASAFEQPAPVAFGGFRERAFEIGGARFRIARLEGPLVNVDGPTLERGVATAARAVSLVRGAFPVPRVEVFVLPVAAGDTPVAFGHVTRGGGIAVLLLVHENAGAEAFVSDWTATHELAHLLLPRVRPSGAWISEGISTYYQEVLRARVGAQRPEDAWRRLCEGFARGHIGGTGRPLPEEAREMHATGAYWRVYWSGAAFALQADLALRARDGSTLDQAVARLDVGHGGRAVRPDRLIAALDGDGPAVVAPLGRRYARLRDFPDLEDTLAVLGVRCGPDGVAFDDAAPRARVRDAIMARVSSPEASR